MQKADIGKLSVINSINFSFIKGINNMVTVTDRVLSANAVTY